MNRMRRAEVRKILQAHRGEVARLARELDVSDVSVKDVIEGKKTSARILEAATKRAEEILAREHVEPAACA